MNTITSIFALLPAIINAIKALEDAVPQAGTGAAKLEALRGMLVAADATVANLWPQIQPAVAVLITFFNATIWKKA